MEIVVKNLRLFSAFLWCWLAVGIDFERPFRTEERRQGLVIGIRQLRNADPPSASGEFQFQSCHFGGKAEIELGQASDDEDLELLAGLWDVAGPHLVLARDAPFIERNENL